jgi:hypothetical protein
MTMKHDWLLNHEGDLATGIMIEMLLSHRDFDWKSSIWLKHFRTEGQHCYDRANYFRKTATTKSTCNKISKCLG